MERRLLKLYVKALLESEELDEFCSAGGGQIQGNTLPLGMEPIIPTTLTTQKRKKRKRKVA
jgi:hypothetical protein